MAEKSKTVQIHHTNHPKNPILTQKLISSTITLPNLTYIPPVQAVSNRTHNMEISQHGNISAPIHSHHVTIHAQTVIHHTTLIRGRVYATGT